MNNTSQFIPFNSISFNILMDIEQREYPFYSGTGFFVYIEPYEEIFYVTAKHCFKDSFEKLTDGKMKLQIFIEEQSNELVQFDNVFGAFDPEDNDDIDILIFSVSKDLEKDKISLLKNRALKLIHQDDVNTVVNLILVNNENVRTVGFPQISKELDYNKKVSKVQPRGFFAKISKKNNDKNVYYFENTNWQDKYDGFSGSPILALCPTFDGKFEPMVLGIILTATETKGTFLSINIVTNTILQYLLSKN
jgi:hypothetical protein